MKHVWSLVIKFIIITAVLFIVLGMFYRVSFANIIWTSLILTLVSYLIGDLFVLPLGENLAATVADFGLAFLTIWMIGAFIFEPNVPVVGAAFVSSLVIAAGEWFFHQYMNKQVLAEPGEARS